MRINKMLCGVLCLSTVICLLGSCVRYEGEENAPDWMWPDAQSKEEESIVTVSVGLSFSSNGDGTCRVKDEGTCQDTELVIPAVSPTGDRVIGIDTQAFSGCTGIRSVVLPEGLENIGELAFDSCERLETVILPSSLRQIGDQAFTNCKALCEIRMPAEVVYIGTMVFHDCSSLRSVVFEKTDRWQVTLSREDLLGKLPHETRPSYETLSDPARAAEALKEEYVYYTWTRQ